MNNEIQGGSEDDDSDDDDIKITIDHNKIDEAKTSYQVKLIIRSKYLTLIQGSDIHVPYGRADIKFSALYHRR